MRYQRLYLILFITMLLTLSGCSSSILSPQSSPYNGQSAFMGDKVRPGLTRKEFISLNGQPYKTSFTFEDGIMRETLFYKERLGTWYILNMAFYFVNDKLVAQKQLGEELLYNDCNHNNNDTKSN